MTEYLVITFVDNFPEYQVVMQKELLKILDAHRNGVLKGDGKQSKIAVYVIGDILLDWS